MCSRSQADLRFAPLLSKHTEVRDGARSASALSQHSREAGATEKVTGEAKSLRRAVKNDGEAAPGYMPNHVAGKGPTGSRVLGLVTAMYDGESIHQQSSH